MFVMHMHGAFFFFVSILDSPCHSVMIGHLGHKMWLRCMGCVACQHVCKDKTIACAPINAPCNKDIIKITLADFNFPSSIRRRALDLLYGMCDVSNAKDIVEELLQVQIH